MYSKTSPVKEIYRIASLAINSKETLLGTFNGMLMMYQQDKFPKEEIEEIRRILAEIEQEIEAGLNHDS
jgi:hypothetical protein